MVANFTTGKPSCARQDTLLRETLGALGSGLGLVLVFGSWYGLLWMSVSLLSRTFCGG